MKKTILTTTIIALLILIPLFISGVYADPPGPPGPGGNPTGGGGMPVGGPIDDGVGVLISLAIAYGSYKILRIWRKTDALRKKESY
jgi:hypothetical protein